MVKNGVFGGIFEELAKPDAESQEVLMHEPRLTGRTKGGMNTKLHTLCDKIRHRIENLFAKFKDWRRIATRYDRCAHTLRSAIYLAATVIIWL
jgi:hypothetical protein